MSSDTIQRIARMEQDVASLGTIVGVFAHPDDETYLAGGLFALARRAGNRVVVVTATKGERGTDDPRRFPPGRLAGDPRARARGRHAGARCGRAGVARLRGRHAGVDPAHERHGARSPRAGRGAARHRRDVRSRRHDRPRRPPCDLAVGDVGVGEHGARRRGCWYGTVTPEASARYASLLAPYGVYMGDDLAYHTPSPSGSHCSCGCRASCSTTSTARCRRCRARRPALIGALGSDVYRGVVQRGVVRLGVRRSRRRVRRRRAHSGTRLRATSWSPRDRLRDADGERRSARAQAVDHGVEQVAVLRVGVGADRVDADELEHHLAVHRATTACARPPSRHP